MLARAIHNYKFSGSQTRGNYWATVLKLIEAEALEEVGHVYASAETIVPIRVHIDREGKILSLSPVTEQPNWLQVFMAMQVIRRAGELPAPDEAVYGPVDLTHVVRVVLPS